MKRLANTGHLDPAPVAPAAKEPAMYAIDQTTLPHATLPGIDHVTLAGRDHGLEQLSVWRQRIDAGAATPPHRHDCEEVVLCEAGEGELHIEDRVVPFRAGTTVTIPRNEPHQIFSTGTVPLEIVAVFAATPVEAFLPDGTKIELPWRS